MAIKKKPAKKKTAKKTTKRMGRPTLYSQEMADKICSDIVSGETLKKIGKKEGYPCAMTILRWAADNKDFCDQYTRAREAAADLFENKILDAADQVTQQNANAMRVKIDAFKWVAAHRQPKRYGDRVQHDIDANVKTTRTIGDFYADPESST